MFILDTDVVTFLHAEHPIAVRRLKEHSDEVVGITIVTRIEILRGRFDRVLKAASNEQFLQAQEVLQVSEAKLNKLLTLYIDDHSLRQFWTLSDRKGLRKLGRADLLITSIVLAQDATLVTRNLKHFKLIPQLKCENWVD
jgi:tRNA(fMet)-specific endonuclease VapC